MEFWQQLHWFITDRCNQKCAFCFREDNGYGEDIGRLEELATIVAKSKIQKVVIGGGEPLVVKGLQNVLEILERAGKYVSIHTNGVSLTDKKLDMLTGLADDIALPVDSSDEDIQKKLRGQSGLTVLRKIPELAKKINKKGIKLGYHTVYTGINLGVEQLYLDLIKKTDFDYWRIYEYNLDLARTRIRVLPENIRGQRAMIKRWKTTISLHRPGKPKEGYLDGALAILLEKEEIMKNKYKDDRIEFISVREPKPSYAFLNNSGDVSYYAWYSGNERRVVGNILTQGFNNVVENLRKIESKGIDFDKQAEEDFINAIQDRPLWARLWDGNYCQEEIDAVRPFMRRAVENMSEFYEEREKRLRKKIEKMC